MNTPEGAVFQPAALAKHSNSGGAVKDFFFPKFPENPKLVMCSLSPFT